MSPSETPTSSQDASEPKMNAEALQSEGAEAQQQSEQQHDEDDWSPRCRDLVCCKYYGSNKEATGWAYNSAARGVILIGAVFLGTALLGLASEAAGCTYDEENCRKKIHGLTPSSLLTAMITISGFLGALVMPIVGAIVDHTRHRKTVAVWTGVFLVVINSVQICVSEQTWFAVAILQTIGPVVFLVHLVVVYAYLPDLTEDWELLTRWCASFVAVRSLIMIPFLIAVVVLASVLPIGEDDTLRADVGTARISQALIASSTAIFFVLALHNGLGDREALRVVPKGQTLFSAGFYKLRDTLGKIATFRAFRLFCIGLCLDSSAVSSFVVITITFSTDFLKLTASQNGIMILSFLFGAILGSKAFPFLSRSMGLFTSLKVSEWAWSAAIFATAGLMRGPDSSKILFYALTAIWGFCFGWTVPASRMVYVAIMPKGQEAEMMGLFHFFGRGFMWLPPLVFTILNEAGVQMNISLLVLPVFFLAGLTFFQFVGSLEDAIEESKRYEDEESKHFGEQRRSLERYASGQLSRVESQSASLAMAL